MNPEEVTIAIVAISGFIGFCIAITSMIFKYLNKRLDLKKGRSLDDKFFDDYIRFKHQVHDRLSKLEKSNPQQAEQLKKTMAALPDLEQDETTESASGRLKNMLHQKE